MDSWRSALVGAAGGAFVELVTLLQVLLAWQSSRRTSSGSILGDPPRLRRYVDVGPHTLVLVTRALLGAVAGAVFEASAHTTSDLIVLSAGAAAPTLLVRLGALPEITKWIGAPPDGWSPTGGAEDAPDTARDQASTAGASGEGND